MISSLLYLPTFVVALHASLVQTAPAGDAVMSVDSMNFPAIIPDYDYALIDRAKLQQLRNQLEEAEYNLMLMQLLQLNMMKIMFILDVIIIIFIFFYAKESN